MSEQYLIEYKKGDEKIKMLEYWNNLTEEYKKNFEFILAHTDDWKHEYKDSFFTDKWNIIYNGVEISVDDFDNYINKKINLWLWTVNKVLDEVEKVSNESDITFSPYNGAETICANTNNTIATDRLSIWSLNQIKKLYNDFYAKWIFLIDKVDRWHSYTWVNQKIGHIWAMLFWDIENIQKWKVEYVYFLDENWKKVLDIDESISYPWIEIIYSLKNWKVRSHKQFQNTKNLNLNTILLDWYNFLFLRATENLVTGQESFEEYKSYVNKLSNNGFIISDSKEEFLYWWMEDTLWTNNKIYLDDDEQFGYAWVNAKIRATSKDIAFQGYVSILEKK